MVKLPFKIVFFSLLIFTLSIIASCSKKKTSEPVLDLGYDYYPLDSGWIRVYEVDSISFNDNTQAIDTFRFTLTELTMGKINGQDLIGHQIINRLVQTDTSNAIQNRGSFFVLGTANNLQRVEDNIRVVKLTFPIGNVSSWNGNMMNSNGRKTFVMQNIGVPFTNKDTTFNNCVTVQEAQTNNLIEEILIKSVYCKNLGLVDFTNNYINTQQSGKSGYKIRQQLKYYHRP